MSYRDLADTLLAHIPDVDEEVRCPGCGGGYDVRALVIHLNDEAKWDREEIADFLDSLDLDLTVQPESLREPSRRKWPTIIKPMLPGSNVLALMREYAAESPYLEQVTISSDDMGFQKMTLVFISCEELGWTQQFVTVSIDPYVPHPYQLLKTITEQYVARFKLAEYSKKVDSPSDSLHDLSNDVDTFWKEVNEKE